jgi:uncharacterized membrane protein
MSDLKAFLLLLPILAVLDLAYLGYIMRGFYDQQIGELARRAGGNLAPRWFAAIIVYLLIPAGIVLFVRPRLATDGSISMAVVWGAIYGLVVYGVYDFTNRSILQKWSWQLTLADLAWGMALCAISSAALQWLLPAGSR